MGYSQVGKALDSDSSISQVRVLLPQCDPLAQPVEHLTFNQGVRGSNPRWVNYLERYRSGHNGAVLKTVRAQAHVGSNPTLSVVRRSTQVAQEAPLLRE